MTHAQCWIAGDHVVVTHGRLKGFSGRILSLQQEVPPHTARVVADDGEGHYVMISRLAYMPEARCRDCGGPLAISCFCARTDERSEVRS